MASIVIKNWDKNNWLSSKSYISKFNNFLIKNNKFNSGSLILDIGCGRGKIMGCLSSKLKLKNKPIGIDLVNHKDKDKRINFKKIDALSYLKKNKKRFDLIMLKQTIHLLQFNEIKTLLIKMRNCLNPNGNIFIFTLDPFQNEIPSFKLMKLKLLKSFKRDKQVLNLISKIYPERIQKKFSFKVKITKKKYSNMITKKYISTLQNLKKQQIIDGLREINSKYKKNISFNDKLVCIIIKNN